jgi:hypothetical protein
MSARLPNPDPARRIRIRMMRSTAGVRRSGFAPAMCLAPPTVFHALTELDPADLVELSLTP